MYRIYYHRLVLSEDLKRVSKSDIQKIMNTIKEKITIAPEKYGKPLRKELKGYYKLRIGEYRVVYKIEKQKVKVFILKIGLRKDAVVYIQATKRIK